MGHYALTGDNITGVYMTQDQAIQMAVEFASSHGFSTANAVIKATFQPTSSPFNLWNEPDDKWVVVFTFPRLAGVDSNLYTIEVNCRTKEVSHQSHL